MATLTRTVTFGGLAPNPLKASLFRCGLLPLWTGRAAIFFLLSILTSLFAWGMLQAKMTVLPYGTGHPALQIWRVEQEMKGGEKGSRRVVPVR